MFLALHVDDAGQVPAVCVTLYADQLSDVYRLTVVDAFLVYVPDSDYDIDKIGYVCCPTKLC